MAGKRKIAPLETFPNEMEARMTAQILEENGIPTVVQPLGGGYGAFGVDSFIHHRVYVNEEQLKDAHELVDSIEATIEATEEDFLETSES